MASLDVNKILYGTDKKKLIAAYESLKSEYTDEKASEYRTLYMGKPISYILENARYIMGEPQFGLPFIEFVVENYPIPYDKMNDLYVLTEGLFNDIAKKISKTDFAKDVEENGLVGSFKRAKDKFLYGKNKAPKTKVSNGLMNETQSEINKTKKNTPAFEAVFGDIEPYTSEKDYEEAAFEYPAIERLAVLVPYAKELNLQHVLFESVSELVENTNEDALTAKAGNIIGCEKIQELFLTESYKDYVNGYTNISLKNAINGAINANLGFEISTTFKESAENTVSPIYTNPMEAVNAIMEESVYDELYKDDRKQNKAELYGFMKEVYESVRDYVHDEYEIVDDVNSTMVESPLFTHIKNSRGITEAVSVEKAFEIINEAVGELEQELESFFEKSVDGSAPRSIASRYTMYREGDKTNQPVHVGAAPEEDDDDDEDSPKSTKVTGSDLPSSTNSKVTKPKKQGILNRISNKALDVDKNAQKFNSDVDRTGVNLKNAAKSVTKIPRGILGRITGIVKDFDEADDNRRKKYMAAPGYRKRVFRNLRVAGMYGLSAYIHPLLAVVTFIGRQLSREKDKRIKNEFLAELDTEIKIAEAKAEQAQNNGHEQERYALMRIADNLKKERSRVNINGKYI